MPSADQPPTEKTTAQSWRPDGVPFAWQPKEAFRLIEEHLQHPDTALLVYVALTRIASNEGSAVFSKPIQYVAKLACVNRRTVERRLPELERLGVLKIDRRRLPGSKANDFHQYTLATECRNPSRHNVATLATVCAASVSQLVENRENEEEEEDAARFSHPSLSQCLEWGREQNIPDWKVKLWYNRSEDTKWLVHGKPMLSPSSALFVYCSKLREQPPKETIHIGTSETPRWTPPPNRPQGDKF